jgi:polyisoprenoid-binding protein YceI
MMKPINLILLLVLLLSTAGSNAQVSNNCKVTFSTMIKGKLYKLESKEATLSLNPKSGELTLKLRLNSIDTELDTVDAYFDTRDEEMVFTGNIGTSLFDLLNQEENSGKTLPISASLNFNKLTGNCVGGYDVFKINNERDELLRNVRFSLFLSFKPKDFALEKYFPALTNDIALQINEAVVNVVE